MIKWHRVEAGWYWTVLPNGETYEIKNMQGQSVLYGGVGRHWIVYRVTKGMPRKLNRGEWPNWDSEEMDREYTMADAKAAVARKVD